MGESVRGSPALDLLHSEVRRYYTQKITAHGPTPLGVDWSCAMTQGLRFHQLLKIWEEATEPVSLNDFGCGYGALLQYLQGRSANAAIDYLGVDISELMIAKARQLHPGAAFVPGHRNPRTADYSLASGVFNVKLGIAKRQWTAYVRQTLRHLWATSRAGFAVNFLAPRPPHLAVAAALYRPWPDEWVSFCTDRLGAQVRLLADYGLGEYTLLVKRNGSTESS